MIKHLETTTIILLWCFLGSVAWCWFVYALVNRFPKALALFSRPRHPLIPALVIGPVLLVIAFRVFTWNLIFPIHLLATTDKLIQAAIVPAMILLLTSGLTSNLARLVSEEYGYWRQKPFARVTEAFGQPLGRSLKKLVMLKSFAASWGQSLPWLFGELIVVECVFNAPGLGLDTWRLARQRDLAGLFINVGWLALLYAICILATETIARWVGRRLESYN